MTANGNAVKIAIASKDENWDEPDWTQKVFHDSGRKFFSISKALNLMTFFQLSWEDVGNYLVSVSCNKDCAVIVVVWEHEDRQDNIINILKDQDWLPKPDQQVTWVKWHWGEVYGKSKAVWSKKIESGATLSFDRPANDLPISVFVVEGSQKI